MTAPDFDSIAATNQSIERACRLVIDGRRAARALGEWLRRFELSEPEFQVLWCLRVESRDGIDQTTLAQRLALSPAQVSATVERLSTHRWIVQHARPGDRRRHLWQLTAAGRTMLHTMLTQTGRLGSDTADVKPAADSPVSGREAAA